MVAQKATKSFSVHIWSESGRIAIKSFESVQVRHYGHDTGFDRILRLAQLRPDVSFVSSCYSKIMQVELIEYADPYYMHIPHFIQYC